MTALAFAAAMTVFLPGVAIFAARTAVVTWRAERRRRARGAWRQITALAPAGRVGRVEEVR